MAFDDMVANWPAQPQTPPPQSPPDTTPPADAAPPGMLGRAWGSLTDAAKYLANPTDIAEEDPEGPGLGKKIGEGFVRGIHDVADAPSVWLARQFGAGDTAAQRVADERKKFEDNYGDSTVAGVGRMAGQTLATAPLMSGAAGLVGRGATMLPGAVGDATRLLLGATPAASTVGRVGQLATQGAASGAVQAGLTADPDQPLPGQMATGALVGGVAGPALGGLTKAVDVLRGYAGGVRPEIAALAQKAQDFGADIPMYKLSDNPTLRFFGNVAEKLPFGGSEAANLENQRALQGVIAQQMGSDADTFGRGVMKATADRISSGYDAALAKVPAVSGGAPLATDLGNIASDAAQYTDPATVGHVGRAIKQVSDTFAGGHSITPEAYQALTNSDGALAKIEAAAPSAAQPYLSDVRDALKARLNDSAPSGVADDLRTLDSQWRAMKTVQPLADKSTTGDIQLPALQQRVISQSNKYDSSTGGVAYGGGGVLGDVADVSKQFFSHLPESGTAPRTQAYEFAKHPVASTAAAIPGLALNMPLQAWMRSPYVSRNIINTSLGGATPNIARALPYGLLGPIDYTRAVQGDQTN